MRTYNIINALYKDSSLWYPVTATPLPWFYSDLILFCYLDNGNICHAWVDMLTTVLGLQHCMLTALNTTARQLNTNTLIKTIDTVYILTRYCLSCAVQWNVYVTTHLNEWMLMGQRSFHTQNHSKSTYFKQSSHRLVSCVRGNDKK